METFRFIDDVKHIMRHNRFLRKYVLGGVREVGLVHLLHIYYSIKWRKSLNGGETEFQQYYELHKKKFILVADMLEDDFSKKTYENVLKYRLTLDIRYLNPIIRTPQYFCKDIFDREYPEVFIDGGAFVGDTIEDFIKYWGRNDQDEFYLWECDDENINSIKGNLKGINYKILKFAMWDKQEVLSFNAGNTGESQIVDVAHGKVDNKNDKINVNADCIDYQHGVNGTYPISKLTFLKMDIEGAEQNALRGAEQLIKKYKPKLAICIYHSDEDMWKIPMMIKEIVPEYKLYVRHHSDVGAETVLYCKI